MIKLDWQYMARAMIILAMALGIAVMMYIVGERYRAVQLQKYDRSLSGLQLTRQRYSDLLEDIALLEQYRTLFDGYRSSGLVGGERRLSWIESLESTNQVIKLPNFTYRLLPQESFERPGLEVKPDIVVNSTAMQLDLGLLHEEDIFAVFEGLRGSIKSLFAVDSCTLTRSAKLDQPMHPHKANLRAACLIRWLTIDAK